MKQVLFVLSHFGANSDSLYQSLDLHPRIQGFRNDNFYSSRIDLLSLTSKDHKLDNASAIYMDELLLNSSLHDISIYPECHIIILIRPPIDSLNEIMSKYKLPQAISYYTFRLNRLRRIAAKAPSVVLLTYADLEAGRGGKIIQDYLQVKEPIQIISPIAKKIENKIPLEQLAIVNDIYEKCLYKMKKSGVITSSSEG